MSSQSFKSISPNVLALCETNLERSIDYSIFSVRYYLSLIRSDLSLTFTMLQFPWRRDFFLDSTCPLKSLSVLIYVFDWLYFIQCHTSFFFIAHCPLLCAKFQVLCHLSGYHTNVCILCWWYWSSDPWATDLCQYIELASELESDPRHTLDRGKYAEFWENSLVLFDR